MKETTILVNGKQLTYQNEVGDPYVFDFYDSIASKYDYPILNYTYDSLSYDTAYFYNASHLNRSGAECFSRHLAEDLKSLFPSL